MKQRFGHPTTWLWYFLGLTGMALVATIFLEDGYARTLTTPPLIQSVKVQDTHSMEMASKACPLPKNGRLRSMLLNSHPEKVGQEMDHEEKPNKKKLGLAIIFLGVLAEKS
jgi:hypothetical protein